MAPGIAHLKNFWNRKGQAGQGRPIRVGEPSDWVNDNTLLCGLSLGLQETLHYLNAAKPTFEQFEQWILERNGGGIVPSLLNSLDDAVNGPLPNGETVETALRGGEPSFLGENGY